MKRVALFGGAFDPPHVGHAFCITNILNASIVDQVWIVPTGDARYDKKAQVSAIHRRKLVECFLGDYFPGEKRVELCTLQLESSKDEGATIDLVDQIKSLHPDCQPLVVIGSDNVAQLNTWRSSERLLCEVAFIVIDRLGSSVSMPAQGAFIVLPREGSVHCDVSSSLIRKLVQSSKVLSAILGNTTVEYIRKQNLYC